MKIYAFDIKKHDISSFQTYNKKTGHEITFSELPLTKENLQSAKGYDAVSGFVSTTCTEEIINELKKHNIKYWLQRAAGFDNINLKIIKKHGIRVFRVPAYSPNAVSEFALLLLLATNRNLKRSIQKTKKGDFTLDTLLGDTVFGKTVGVLGAGKIGQCFIENAKGLGAKIIVYDEFVKKNFPDLAQKMGFEFVSKEDLLKNADFISLHMPLNEETHHIINKDSLSQMKNTAVIVNTSRGGLVNTTDLLDALDSNVIRGAAIDVYENEKKYFFNDFSNKEIDDPILKRILKNDKLIVTPHQAFFTNLSLEQIAKTTLDSATSLDNGEENIYTELHITDDGNVIY